MKPSPTRMKMGPLSFSMAAYQSVSIQSPSYSLLMTGGERGPGRVHLRVVSWATRVLKRHSQPHSVTRTPTRTKRPGNISARSHGRICIARSLTASLPDIEVPSRSMIAQGGGRDRSLPGGDGAAEPAHGAEAAPEARAEAQAAGRGPAATATEPRAVGVPERRARAEREPAGCGGGARSRFQARRSGGGDGARRWGRDGETGRRTE